MPKGKEKKCKNTWNPHAASQTCSFIANSACQSFSLQYSNHRSRINVFSQGKFEGKGVFNFMKTRGKTELLYGKELRILILQSTYFMHPLVAYLYHTFPRLNGLLLRII